MDHSGMTTLTAVQTETAISASMPIQRRRKFSSRNFASSKKIVTYNLRVTIREVPNVLRVSNRKRAYRSIIGNHQYWPDSMRLIPMRSSGTLSHNFADSRSFSNLIEFKFRSSNVSIETACFSTI